MQNNPSPNNFCFYRSDPLARLLIDKWNISPITFGVLSIAISVIVTDVYLAFSWKERTDSMIVNSFPLVVAALFVNPVIYGYYLWSFQQIIKIIESLKKDNVLKIDESIMNQILTNSYGRKWYWFVALGVGAFFFCWIFVQYEDSRQKGSIPLLSPLLIAIATCVVVYCGVILIFNLFSNVWILNFILDGGTLDINPLHPDHCGGLKSLSDYSLKTAYLVGVCGLWVGVIEYQLITHKYLYPNFFYLIIPVYIAISIVVFFGPLLAAHNEMEEAKKELLHEISQQYKNDYEQIRHQLNGDIDDLKKSAEKLKELRNFYDTTDQFPVWPFNILILRQYFLTVSTPLISFLLIILKELLGKLLN